MRLCVSNGAAGGGRSNSGLYVLRDMGFYRSVRRAWDSVCNVAENRYMNCLEIVMKCPYHAKPGSIKPRLTEEFILRYDYLPGGMKGWRRYRIEYGFECSCPEGIIYLPPQVDPDEVELLLNLLPTNVD